MRLSGREGHAAKHVQKWPETAKRLVLLLLWCRGAAVVSVPGHESQGSPVLNFLLATKVGDLGSLIRYPRRGAKGKGEWGLKAVSSQKQTSFLERAVYHSFSFVVHLFLCVLSKNYFPNSNM